MSVTTLLAGNTGSDQDAANVARAQADLRADLSGAPPDGMPAYWVGGLIYLYQTGQATLTKLCVARGDVQSLRGMYGQPPLIPDVSAALALCAPRVVIVCTDTRPITKLTV